MLTVSRRGFLVLGGLGAGTALAGCGSEPDPRGEGRDQELLDAALEAESGLGATYESLAAAGEGPEAAEVLRRSAEASSERQQELGRLGASASSGGAGSAGGNGSLEPAVAAANATIAAYREGAGLLSTPDARATTTGFLAQVAAEQATIRGLLGVDQVPDAFVTGGTEKPLEHPDEETATSTTTTSTTTTDEQ